MCLRLAVVLLSAAHFKEKSEIYSHACVSAAASVFNAVDSRLFLRRTRTLQGRMGRVTPCCVCEVCVKEMLVVPNEA